MESTQLNNMEDNKIEKPSLYGEIEEIEDEVEKRFKQFKNFDKISCYYPFDHRFVDKSKRIDPESKVAKKMQLEWEILEKNLPCSIFVRTYKERFDIMRVAVAGLEGTPYCHGLFFFDIYFPSSYPARPPEIVHHSNDLNSNYRDGKVPTSLPNFNQWYKKTSQRWNPKQSDILQVLVSIQHVLNGIPYVKESLLNSFIEGQSKKSNKEVFMLNCEAMLCTLKFPPVHFKDLVQGHYRVRAHQILLICKAQMKINNDNALNQLFFKLLKAFEVNGAYCRHHYDISLQEAESSEHQEERSQSNGYTYKFINKFKNML
ncbi:hypothetical protein Dsin_000124 [Dipteronia sinensis]|uniref:UBC core domain-containing protein n=1 Tax=Dipteronia sinensis TaxID=43782 RepID=A0AAD9ZK19_9ROSI|nr:hypothetical protein Dsin_000124 [Dipteronia sinensis]